MYTRERPFLRDTDLILLVMALRTIALQVRGSYIYFAKVLNGDGYSEICMAILEFVIISISNLSQVDDALADYACEMHHCIITFLFT
jgi:hypothetical protein